MLTSRDIVASAIQPTDNMRPYATDVHDHVAIGYGEHFVSIGIRVLGDNLPVRGQHKIVRLQR